MLPIGNMQIIAMIIFFFTIFTYLITIYKDTDFQSPDKKD